MNFKLKRTWDKISAPVEGSVGVAVGLISTGFLSEVTARSIGWTDWMKAGVKSAVKLSLGTLFLGTGAGFPETNFIMFPAALAAFGSMPLDWAEAQWPGGINGLAEDAAVTVRTWASGFETVSKELSDLRGKAGEVYTKNETPGYAEQPGAEAPSHQVVKDHTPTGAKGPGPEVPSYSYQQ